MRLSGPETAQPRHGEIQEWSSNLSKCIEQFEAAYGQHVERIKPLLRPPSLGQNGGKDSVPEQSLCPVADKMREQCRRIHALCESLTAISESLGI